MIVNSYIKEFEKLGFGMFVHFGAYSVYGHGEWAKACLNISDETYEGYVKAFCPKESWARELAEAAASAGCKYITLTTRHHDGFSLYDTCGLNQYDAPHICGRDLVREYVDACREYGLIPFFYHTLLDWHEPSYKTDFKQYLVYLRESVKLLCTNYGTIGGIWFDGIWDRPNDDWEEDALYGMIRSYQPNAMIINNTGLSAQGALGHPELDSVTFERGKPQPMNMEGAPKYIASEMCQVFNDHWGYAKEDLNYKSPADMIRDLAICRRCGSNLLMNVGPTEDGTIRLIDRAMLDLMGQWVKIFGEAIYEPRPSGVVIENKDCDYILQKDNVYYLFCCDLPMVADPNVALVQGGDYTDVFTLDRKIAEITWIDNGEPLTFEQTGNRVCVQTEPFCYGRNLVIRVARIQTK